MKFYIIRVSNYQLHLQLFALRPGKEQCYNNQAYEFCRSTDGHLYNNPWYYDIGSK